MNLDFSTLFITISILSILIILLEFSYSVYKKDNIYSVRGTLGNLLRGIVYKLITKKLLGFYFIIFYSFYGYPYYSNVSINIISFISCLIIVDFFAYLLHRMNHSIDFFWMFHFVHHSDNKFNLSTGIRVPWCEQLYAMIILIAPPLLLNFQPEVISLSIYSIGIYQFFCHSQYLKFPKFFNILFITQETHKIHHSQNIKYQNSNFGSLLNIWDKLFNTFVPYSKDTTIGIQGYVQNNFIKMETEPIIKYYNKQFKGTN